MLFDTILHHLPGAGAGDSHFWFSLREKSMVTEMVWYCFICSVSFFFFLLPFVINIVAVPVHFLISLLFVVNCSYLTQPVISTFVPILTSIPGVESGRGKERRK